MAERIPIYVAPDGALTEFAVGDTLSSNNLGSVGLVGIKYYIEPTDNITVAPYYTYYIGSITNFTVTTSSTFTVGADGILGVDGGILVNNGLLINNGFVKK